jgi:hypothetical protein
LLTLFGERFAQQFLSESYTYYDHISTSISCLSPIVNLLTHGALVFAMAPLGIVTALVCAIRIGGPLWLKALVGRAKENRAAVEVEVMSSTSHEVCDIWNGRAIVRSMGRPKLKQLLYSESEKLNDPECLGLTTLEEKDGYMVKEGQ